MNSSNMMLIVAAEIALLLLVICIFLVVQNRSLRQLIAQMKEKAQGLIKELKQAKLDTQHLQQESSAQVEDNSHPQSSYLDFIEEQIELTRNHHSNLNSSQDIVLDIAPEAPLVHRTPALRHAMLLAEKNAIGLIQNNESPDWEELGKRYETIFNFYEDFSEEAGDNNSGEAEAIKAELENAQKRVANLEKFKKLYFELEEKWEDSKKEAESHFEHLTSMTENLENGEAVHSALQKYHQSYNDFADILETGIDTPDILATNTKSNALGVAAEVKQLRAVAADQHRIIEGLQKQLMSASTDDERHNAVAGLQSELQKQMRFAKESETCIQLLEDELNSAHVEIDAMRSKLSKLPEIKSDYIDLRRQYDELEMKYHAGITENRKLQKKLQSSNNSQASDAASAAEAARLRMELAEVAAKYNDLEEKFLDLKLQQ